MREVPGWTEYFMHEAESAALRSKDPSTQVGTAIVVDDDVVSKGYNGFAPGVRETEDRWQRPAKYPRVIHAEMNAIARAARRGVAIKGGTLYCTHAPCSNCTKMIIAAGIKKVVSGVPPHGWDEEHALSIEMFEESGVQWILLDEDYDEIERMTEN